MFHVAAGKKAGPVGERKPDRTRDVDRYFVRFLRPLLLTQCDDPAVSLIGDFRQHQQVVAAEAVGAPPAIVVIAIEPLERDIETRPAFGFVLPDGGFHAADPNFLDGLVGGFLLGSHVRLLSKRVWLVRSQSD